MAKEKTSPPLPLLPCSTNQTKNACKISPRRAVTTLLSWLLMISFILLLSSSSAQQWRTFVLETATAAIGSEHEQVVCDLYNGTWVRDTAGGVMRYTNVTCPTLPESKNCGKYGKERDFVHWKWRPHGCEMPSFEPEQFLNIVRGKKLAFVGDSVARNQMESLLCLLSQVETPINIHKDAEDRSVTWYFRSHDFTLMKLWTKFLVEASERQINSSASGVYDLHLDRLDTSWTGSLNQTDILTISDGHWFFRKNYLYEGGKRIGCTFCSEPDVKDLGVVPAVRRVFQTTLQFLQNECQGCTNRLTVLVRTFSPAHFENGAWNGGGYCNRTGPVSEGEMSLSGTYWEMRDAQVEALVERRAKGEKAGDRIFEVLDVTKAMMMRPDGHPGIHWNNEWMKGYSDCVHWCLPGPIDLWNEMLLVKLQRFREKKWSDLMR